MKSLQNQFNLGVWSIGEHVQRNVLPALAKTSAINLIGIFTRKEENLKKYSEQFKCIPYSNEEELLKDEKIDALYIASPDGLHYEHAKKSLLSGKHVIVEKSSFSSLEQANEIISLAKQKNLLVMEAFPFPFHFHFQSLKKLLESKKYGRVYSMEVCFGFPHLSPNNIRYSKELGGGALSDAGGYPIYAVIQLLGLDTKLIYSKQNIEENFEVDTSGLAVLEKNNISAVCKWVFGASYKNEIKIWCEKGNILADRFFSKPDTFESEIVITHNGQVVEKIATGKDNHFVNMFNFFSRCIKEENFEKNYNLLLAQANILSQIRKK